MPSFGNSNQREKYISHFSSLLTELKIQLAEQTVEIIIDGPFRTIGLKGPVWRTNSVLGFFDRFESAGGKERKNCRSQAGDAFRWDQHRAAQHVSIDSVQHVVLLRNSPGVDDSFHMNALAFHAIENHASV